MKKTIITVTSFIACAFAAYAAENAAVATTAPVKAPATPVATAPAAKAPVAAPAAEKATVAVVAVEAAPACESCQKSKPINTLADEEITSNLLERFSASVTVGFESEYIFRGIKEAGASINPEVDMAYDLGKGFSVYAGVWANTPVDSNIENEIDVYTGVAYEFKNFTFDLGYLAYLYSDNDNGENPNSHEIKFAVSYDTVDLLGEFNVSPTVALYYDFTLGVYTLEGGVTYSAPVTKWIADRNWGSIDLAAVYGWATPANHGGYTYAALSADAVVAVNEYCNLSVGIRYSYAHNVDVANRYQDRVWFGTSMTVGF